MRAAPTDEPVFVSHIELPRLAQELEDIMNTNRAKLVQDGRKLFIEVITLRRDIDALLVDYKNLSTENAHKVEIKYWEDVNISSLQNIIRLSKESLNQLNDKYHAMSAEHTIMSEVQDARIKELLAKIAKHPIDVD